MMSLILSSHAAPNLPSSLLPAAAASGDVLADNASVSFAETLLRSLQPAEASDPSASTLATPVLPGRRAGEQKVELMDLVNVMGPALAPQQRVIATAAKAKANPVGQTELAANPSEALQAAPDAPAQSTESLVQLMETPAAGVSKPKAAAQSKPSTPPQAVAQAITAPLLNPEPVPAPAPSPELVKASIMQAPAQAIRQTPPQPTLRQSNQDSLQAPIQATAAPLLNPETVTVAERNPSRVSLDPAITATIASAPTPELIKVAPTQAAAPPLLNAAQTKLEASLPPPLQALPQAAVQATVQATVAPLLGPEPLSARNRSSVALDPAKIAAPANAPMFDSNQPVARVATTSQTTLQTSPQAMPQATLQATVQATATSLGNPQPGPTRSRTSAAPDPEKFATQPGQPTAELTGVPFGSVEKVTRQEFDAGSDSANSNATVTGAAVNALVQGIARTAESNVTSNASTLSVAADVGSSEWGKALGQQLIKMDRGGHQVAELQLNPPGLGPLKVTLNMNNQHMEALFVSAHSSVRAAVEAALPQLRASLADNGISLGNTSVSAESQQQTAYSQAQDGAAQRRSYRETSLLNTPSPTARPLTEPLRRNNASSVDTYA